jgi:DNA invertase Pin-like site-specific DNA recombinase
MKVACYCRVSSAVQADANGVDMQRTAINAWLRSSVAAESSGVPEHHWFEDMGVSGKSMRRPQWTAMMDRVKAGEFDTVVVYDLSRAGRTLKGLLEWVDEMITRGIRIVFIKESLDLNTSMGRMIFSIMGAIAEYQRALTADRVRDGVATAIAKRGGRWGSAITQHPDFTAENQAKILAGASSGASMTELERRTGIERRRIKNWLKWNRGTADTVAST